MIDDESRARSGEGHDEGEYLNPVASDEVMAPASQPQKTAPTIPKFICQSKDRRIPLGLRREWYAAIMV